MKKLIALVLLIVCLSGCGPKAAKPPLLHNDSLGVDIALGASKESIDKQFGEPVAKDGKYYYVEHMLVVKYFDGKAISLFTTIDEWSVLGNKVGHSRDAVIASMGEPSVPNSCLYAYDDQWNLTKTTDDIGYYVFFSCDESNHVNRLTIQRAD